MKLATHLKLVDDTPSLELKYGLPRRKKKQHTAVSRFFGMVINKYRHYSSSTSSDAIAIPLPVCTTYNCGLCRLNTYTILLGKELQTPISKLLFVL